MLYYKVIFLYNLKGLEIHIKITDIANYLYNYNQGCYNSLVPKPLYTCYKLHRISCIYDYTIEEIFFCSSFFVVINFKVA